jgi:hypothetical protein
MNPYKTALWIAKFVAALALLIVVIPYGLFLGGAYVLAKTASAYHEHQHTVHMRDVETCVKANGESAREVCDLNPEHPIITDATTCLGKSTGWYADTKKDVQEWCSKNPQHPLAIKRTGSAKQGTFDDAVDLWRAEDIACGGDGGQDNLNHLGSGDNAGTCWDGK